MAEHYEIIFGEATRLMARQEANLDHLRVRSLGVLSAGGLIAGLAGASGGQQVRPAGASIVALIALTFMAVTALWIQWPGEWDFSLDIKPMIERVRVEDKVPLEARDVAYNWAR